MCSMVGTVRLYVKFYFILLLIVLNFYFILLLIIIYLFYFLLLLLEEGYALHWADKS